jgi:hypothetical protein
MRKLLGLAILLAIAPGLVSAAPSATATKVTATVAPAASMMGGAGGATHTITVNVVYDFSLTNSCSTTVTSGCVKQFNVYNTTGGSKALIFSIPAPVGVVASQTVTGTSPTVSLPAGVTTLSVMAATPDPVESAPVNVTISVQPNAPTSCNVVVN